jgi:hypothetical protein
MPPVEGELFETLQEAQNRVRDYSLAARFQVVGGQGSTAVRKNLWCIHHGKVTRNDRGLSATVEREPNSVSNSQIKQKMTPLLDLTDEILCFA